ncbi:MAG: hypothetical protein II563_05055 [Treponema sp.]|nr:hypothetical protein [Treponema sp.]
MQKENKKTLKAVFAALFLFLTLSSIIFVTMEAGHECDHDDCPVCFVMELVRVNFSLLGFIFTIAVSSIHATKTYEKKSFHCENHFSNTFSLISQKIRIND